MDVSSSLRVPHCCHVTTVDTKPRDPHYVLKGIHNPVTNSTCASVSSNVIKTYSLSQAALQHVGDLKGHDSTITDVAYSIHDMALLHSSSTDASVRTWDLRTGQETERFNAQANGGVLCFSVLEHIAAAGVNGAVHFWDRRTGKKLGSFTDTHMDDVTQVKFHAPSKKMLSASSDGLIAVFDVSTTFDEDKGFQAALNVGTSVEEMGFFGTAGQKLWVRTGTESLHCWEWLCGTDDDQPGGDLPFADFTDARGTAVQAADACMCAASLEQISYLIGCHYDPTSNQAFLLAGNADGAFGAFPIIEASDNGISSTSASIAPPVLLFEGAHTSVVRSAQCFGDGVTGPFCLTGGEDSKLCVWSLDAACPAVVKNTVTRSNDSGPERVQHKKANRMANPY